MFGANEATSAPWRALADLVHCAPSSFVDEEFCAVVIGGCAPSPESKVGRFRALLECNGKNVLQKLIELQPPYVVIRTSAVELGFVLEMLPLELRRAVVAYEKLDTLIWYYEELECPQLSERIVDLIENQKQEPTFG